MKPQTVRMILVMLLLALFYAVCATESTVFGCDFPSLNWAAIPIYSWRPNSSVHVFIDSRFNETDRSQLAQGLINWGLYSSADCSGVAFFGFDTMDMSGIAVADMPPDNTVWVISETTVDAINPPPGPSSSGQIRVGGFPIPRIVAQKIRINPVNPNQPQYAWFAFFTAHETGHAFGLREMAGTPGGGPDSVMAGARS